VISTVLQAEGKQLEDVVEKLDGGILLFDEPVAGRVGHQRSQKHGDAVIVEEIEEVVLFRFMDGSQHALGMDQGSYNAAELCGTS